MKDILDKIYIEKIIKILVDNDYKKENLKDFLKNQEIFLGNEYEEFIINLLPKGKEGYLFRCEIAKNKNCDYPVLYSEISSANKYNTVLWESHMNKFFIDDVYNNFSKKDFDIFIDDKLDKNLDFILEEVNKRKNKEKINFDETNLIESVKTYALNKKDFSFIYDLVDVDKLREYLSLNNVSFDIYNEFDKIEDEPKFCLDNFFKYDEKKLISFLKGNNVI